MKTKDNSEFKRIAVQVSKFAFMAAGATLALALVEGAVKKVIQ